MEQIKWLKATSQQDKLFIKIKLSLEEIEAKHPNRTDLIKSMSDSLQDVCEVSLHLRRANEYQKAIITELYRIGHENLELRAKLNTANTLNHNLYKDATL